MFYTSVIISGSKSMFSLVCVSAGVAQSAEHLICNQAVAGSSPIASSSGGSRRMRKRGGIPERSKGADCKSAGQRPTEVRILLPPLGEHGV